MNFELSNILAAQNLSVLTTTPDPDSMIACDLNHYGLLKISGADATLFLQGQFSNDVGVLDGKNSQLSSYNSPKGRMLASFRLFKLRNDYFMRLPLDTLEKTQKRLSMYIMRSKVTLSNESAAYIGMGLSGPKIHALLTAAEFSPPKESNGMSVINEIIILSVADNSTRYEVYGSVERLNFLIEKIKDKLSFHNNNSWRYLDILAGIPNIYASTMEEFVPQMINYALIDGVSFNKGCYPGQEIVARMHYLGNLKKRMYLCHIETDQAINANDEIFEHDSGKNQSVGQVVDVVPSSTQGLDALCVLQIASADNAKLSIKATNGPRVVLRDLPYKFKP